MPFEPRPGHFSLFRNTKKTDSAHPDYQFKIILDQDLINNLQEQLGEGKTPTLYGGAWVKQRDNDSPFISGMAKPPYSQQPASEEVVDSMMERTPELSTDTRTTEEIIEEGLPEESSPPPPLGDDTDDLPF